MGGPSHSAPVHACRISIGFRGIGSPCCRLWGRGLSPPPLLPLPFPLLPVPLISLRSCQLCPTPPPVVTKIWDMFPQRKLSEADNEAHTYISSNSCSVPSWTPSKSNWKVSFFMSMWYEHIFMWVCVFVGYVCVNICAQASRSQSRVIFSFSFYWGVGWRLEVLRQGFSV